MPMFLAPDGSESEIADSAAKFLSRAIPLDRLHGTAVSPALSASVRADFAAMGWFGLVLPEVDGGSGLSAVEHALFFREVGRHCGPVDILAQGLAAMVTDDGRLRAALLAGEQCVALAVADGPAFGCSARMTPRSRCTSSATAHGCSTCPRSRRPRSEPRSRDRDAHDRPRHPGDDRGSSDGDVWRLGQLGAPPCWSASPRRALDLIVEYAKVRETFGRKIGSWQAVRHPCADMAVRVEAARCAALVRRGRDQGGPRDAHAHLDAAKHLANLAALANADTNIQLHGGIGVTDEHDAHLLLKHACCSRACSAPSARCWPGCSTPSWRTEPWTCTIPTTTAISAPARAPG